VTVASVLERDGRFLLVEEETTDGILLNQPAGHLERGESIIEGTLRETLEESAWTFLPEWLVGIYHWPHPKKDITYLRFAFTGKLGEHDSARPLDSGILRTIWMTPDEIRASTAHHRSPLVLQCVEDYLAQKRYPLDILTHFDSA
jgi:8-oxo-dGTP pyrophosphatase MutT (NUDIX family)